MTNHLYRFTVRNANPTLVYNCVVYTGPLTAERGGGNYEAVFPVVPPEGTLYEDREKDWFAPENYRGPVAFTDTEGRHWIRRANGTLKQRSAPALTC